MSALPRHQAIVDKLPRLQLGQMLVTRHLISQKQLEDALVEVSPAVGWYVPAAQLKQLVEPVNVWYLPIGQLMQLDDPDVL